MEIRPTEQFYAAHFTAIKMAPPFRIATTSVWWTPEREKLGRGEVIQIGTELYRLLDSKSEYDSKMGFSIEMRLVPQDDWSIAFPELQWS